MSVLDDLRDLETGRVRVETGEYTDWERHQIRKGSIVFAVGVVVLALSGDYWLMAFAMAVAGVFVRVLFGKADK